MNGSNDKTLSWIKTIGFSLIANAIILFFLVISERFSIHAGDPGSLWGRIGYLIDGIFFLYVGMGILSLDKKAYDWAILIIIINILFVGFRLYSI